VATRETRQERGQRRGQAALRTIAQELRDARIVAGLSQAFVASLVGWKQSELSRLETFKSASVTLPRLGELAAVLGLELRAGLFPIGDPLRDKGHQALIRRFLSFVSGAFAVAREVPFPNTGDRRAWDVILRIAGQRIGVEAESRVRDIQAAARRIHERERDGRADVVLVVLADTAHNRLILPALLDALGDRFRTPRRSLFAALRTGRPLPGCGVILV
jgi:transcriptional regulator with XRE-family HTH domain